MDITTQFPELMINQCTCLLHDFVQSAQHSGHITQLMCDFALHQTARFIYFSNLIEDSGLELANTTLLVQSIVAKHPIDHTHLVLSRKERKNAYAIPEVTQHALAFRHMCIDNVDQPLTVDLIKETHLILMSGLPDSEHAGEWRTGRVFAGHHEFASLACPMS
jgi:Fic family protein